MHLHLGSLKSTQAAQVALGCASNNPYASPVLSKLPKPGHPHSIYARQAWTNYRLTQSASELSGFTCTRSLTMNEKFQCRKIVAAECGIENFEFIVSERVQVNPDNSRAMSELTL